MASPPPPAVTTPLNAPQPPSTPAFNFETPSTPGVKTETGKEVTAPNLTSRSPDTSAASTPYTIIIPSFSGWFSFDEIHETERKIVPEFFDGKSASRNPKAYKYIRDMIIKRFRANPSKKITFTEARKGLVGDVGSIRRVFDFLEIWGLINYTPSSKPSTKEKRDVVENVEKKEGPKKLCSSCRSACSIACFATDKSDIILCARCFVRGNYQPGLSSSDFKRLDISEETKTDWTDKETLHLLEGVFHYSDDWKKVAEYVGSRTEKECVTRFISLPFGEQFMGPTEEKDDIVGSEYGQKSNMESFHKRRRLTPLADTSNPIMAQVAFLSALVGSETAVAAAQSAITALHEGKHEGDALAADGRSIVLEAKSQLEKEQQDVEKSITDIIKVEMKEIQEKMKHFEEVELQIEKEWQQLRYMKDLFFADQLALIQRKARGGNVEKEKKIKTAEVP